jgi:hypothetical protein
MVLAVLAVWACAQSEGAGRIDRDTLSQRQKDSLVSTMPLPGASRIRDAQRAQDAAAERLRGGKARALSREPQGRGLIRRVRSREVPPATTTESAARAGAATPP